MVVRPIDYDELDAFAAYSGRGDWNKRFKDYLVGMIEKRCIHPEWCFVAEKDGRFVGRITYWATPSSSYPIVLDFFEIPWNDEYLEVGVRLLQCSLTQLYARGVESIRYTIEKPSLESKTLEQRLEILQRVGFSLRRKALRFEWDGNDVPIIRSERLLFRTLDDVGEGAFIDTIKRVSEDSFDRSIQSDRNKMGPEQAARDRFDILKEIPSMKVCWQLGYTPAGELVGLIMPITTDSGHVIYYIGVLPEHRGQGYVDDLLSQGTSTLESEGARLIRASVDVKNLPMVDAFRRAGYSQFATRLSYSIEISRLSTDH